MFYMASQTKNVNSCIRYLKKQEQGTREPPTLFFWSFLCNYLTCTLLHGSTSIDPLLSATSYQKTLFQNIFKGVPLIKLRFKKLNKPNFELFFKNYYDTFTASSGRWKNFCICHLAVDNRTNFLNRQGVPSSGQNWGATVKNSFF